MNKTFSKNIKRLRSHFEMTPEAAATAIGIKLETFLSYEASRAEPSQEILKKIADAFTVTNLYNMLYDPGFLITEDSCHSDVACSGKQQRHILDKYLNSQGSIKKAVNVLLQIK
ncbi:MAG TPA: helix-turn-helix transcriptional regulator [Chryseosolibacter sp.]